MKQVMVIRFECENCGSQFERASEIKYCKYCGGDLCPECTFSNNYKSDICEWCQEKKEELERFVDGELGMDRAMKMLEDIRNGV